MGYYVTGEGQLTIPNGKHEAALEALKELNNLNDLKRGGRSPSLEGQNDFAPREDRWFSWMPWNYNETVTSVADVLELLGFAILSMEDDGKSTTYTLLYDNKTGQEDLFLERLSKFITNGWLDWTGEDHAMWRQDFVDGVLTNRTGKTIWI